MNKKSILQILVAIFLIVFIGMLYVKIKTPTVASPQMNLLLITLDTTRADHLGCYGYTRPTSPNLDKLAAGSIQFDLAISQAAVTPVSHASIFTGLNPYNHGLRVLHGLKANRLVAEHKTLAEIWRDSGGETAAFVSAFPVTASFGLDQGFKHFDTNFPQADGKGLISIEGIVDTAMSQRSSDSTTKSAIEWLNKKADFEMSLFMWVHYFDPHDPELLPPKEVLDKFKPASQKEEDRLLAIYDAEIFYMDSHIGKLLDAFKKRGLRENTIVIVVADHGEGLGDHNWWSHGILYQEQINVPLIMHIPNIKGGKRVSSMVSTVDLMPTILEAAKIDPSIWPTMDGNSLLEVMKIGRTAKQSYVYSDSVNILTYGRPGVSKKFDQKDDKLYSIMDGTYKLIYHQLRPNKTEFYNLKTDPNEIINLADSKPLEMQVLMRYLKNLDAFSNVMPDMSSSDLERIEKLKSLGYLQ